ncbi:MAG: thiamine pyrophosphate-binding protein, partial [Dehalococcoidia bacterium]
MTTAKNPVNRATNAAYGSDVVIDMLQNLGIEYIALNPGASYRGIHDSLVNYAGGKPEIILCNHEGIAVAVAHGYAHAAGKPMAAAVHNVVGLLNASERIYSAWLDKTEVIVIGGTGPMGIDLRRPGADWIHTALVQGQAVREFTKYDDQPHNANSIPDSMLRAYQMATVEPKGPVYLCYDADLQEAALENPVPMPDPADFPVPAEPQANPEALRRTADLLLGAKRPVIAINYIGNEAAVAELVKLAELLGAAVVDEGDLFNFPNRHPLNLSGVTKDVLSEADVVLALNLENPEMMFSTTDRRTRKPRIVFGEDTKVIDVTLRHYALKSWAQSYAKMFPRALSISADVKQIIPALVGLVQENISAERKQQSGERTAALSKQHDEIMAKYQEQAAMPKDGIINQAFIAQQTWEIIKDHDWSLLDRDLRAGWARRLWDIKRKHQYFGTTKAGIGCALGRAIGAAIANRGTGRLN